MIDLYTYFSHFYDASLIFLFSQRSIHTGLFGREQPGLISEHKVALLHWML